MITVFKGIKHDHVLVFDAEYNEGSLIQFAGILFRKIEKDIFQIERSLTIYVKLEEGEINRFIRDFTGITDSFLNTFGVTLAEAKEEIEQLVNVEADSMLVVSHGITNDRRILFDNGVNLYYDKNERDIEGICTYNAAKRLLKRDKRLTLTDVAAESGIYLSNGHNAFEDAWATVSVFCLMCKLEEENKNEKILQSGK